MSDMLHYVDGKCIRITERIARKEHHSSGGYWIPPGGLYWEIAFSTRSHGVVSKRYCTNDLAPSGSINPIMPTIGDSYSVAVPYQR